MAGGCAIHYIDSADLPRLDATLVITSGVTS